MCVCCVCQENILVYLYAGCVYIYTGQTDILLNTHGSLHQYVCMGFCSSVCVGVCVGVYSQRSQLGHVVEAGQRDEGDVVVVEGAGRQTQEKNINYDKHLSILLHEET